ncbi:hypothetical protein ATER59S_04418 [Aquamicrobium terrae]
MNFYMAASGVKALRASVSKTGNTDFGQTPQEYTALTITVADLKGRISSIHMLLDMGAAGDEIAQAIVDAIENHPGKGSIDDLKVKAKP